MRFWRKSNDERSAGWPKPMPVDSIALHQIDWINGHLGIT